MTQLLRNGPAAAFDNDVRAGKFPFLFGLCVPLAIFCVTVLVFFPVLENGFVNWDDGMNFLENPHYRGLGWTQVRWMFTTFHGSNYRPLAWITSGLDYMIWETEAFGYHLTSLLLHAVNAILFYFLARRLLELARITTSNRKELLSIAFFSALFFSSHPLRVEVVAWASARNDVVAGLFGLCTLLAYLKYATAVGQGPRQWRWLVGATILYALTLLSKGTGVTLPLVFVALDVYPLGRLGGGNKKWFGKSFRQEWFDKLPFIILAGIAAAVALAAKESTAAVLAWDSHSFASRAAQACYGLIFYLGKTILPVGLSPLYQLTPQFSQQKMPLVLFGFVVMGVTVGLWLARRKWPAGLAGWFCYVSILAPVLGFIQSGPQITADRYSYLACMPWAVLSAAGLHRLWQWGKSVDFKTRTPRIFVLGMPLVIVFGILSGQQSQHWKNSATLWQRVLDTDQNSTIAHNNLGNYLVDQGKLEEAKTHYLRAIAIEPTYAQAHVNLGMVLSRQGNLKESMAHIRVGLKNDPGSWQGHHALGIDFAILGAWEEAAEEFRRSLRLARYQSGIYVDLARVLARQGKTDEAIQHLEEAIRIKPDSLQARRELAKLTDARRKGL